MNNVCTRVTINEEFSAIIMPRVFFSIAQRSIDEVIALIEKISSS